jgi:hypothetical protein
MSDPESELLSKAPITPTINLKFPSAIRIGMFVGPVPQIFSFNCQGFWMFHEFKLQGWLRHIEDVDDLYCVYIIHICIWLYICTYDSKIPTLYINAHDVAAQPSLVQQLDSSQLKSCKKLMFLWEKKHFFCTPKICFKLYSISQMSPVNPSDISYIFMFFPWVSHGFPMVEAAPGVDHLGWSGAGWRHFARDSRLEKRGLWPG